MICSTIIILKIPECTALTVARREPEKPVIGDFSEIRVCLILSLIAAYDVYYRRARVSVHERATNVCIKSRTWRNGNSCNRDSPIAVRETSIRKPVDFLLISSGNRLIVIIPFLRQRLSSSLRNRPLHSQNCFATRRGGFLPISAFIVRFASQFHVTENFCPNDPTIDLASLVLRRSIRFVEAALVTVSLRCRWKSDFRSVEH